MHSFGQALCLDVSKYLRCLKWKRKRLPSAPSLANCSSKLLPKGSLTTHGFKVDAIKNIFCTSMIARKVKPIYCIYLWLLVNNSDISSPLLPESLTVPAWHPWLHCSLPCFSFKFFLGGIDDLQVIQSLVIKSYFMVATWDIVGRSPAPASHFAFFNF